MTPKTIALLTILLSTVGGALPAPAAARAGVRSCAQTTMTRAGAGVVYKGAVDNEDYKLSVTIPPGLTGWGGAAREAPFHGFTIFLGPQTESCIVIEVHLRIDDADAARPSPKSISLTLGRARAWQSVETGNLGRTRVTNVTTFFSFEQADQIDDGEVILITPSVNLPEARRPYDAFLGSLKFGR